MSRRQFSLGRTLASLQDGRRIWTGARTLFIVARTTGVFFSVRSGVWMCGGTDPCKHPPRSLPPDVVWVGNAPANRPHLERPSPERHGVAQAPLPMVGWRHGWGRSSGVSVVFALRVVSFRLGVPSFSMAFYEAQDKFDRYQEFDYNAALANLKYRSIVDSVEKDQRLIAMRRTRHHGPVLAFESSRQTSRRILCQPAEEISRVFTRFRRRAKENGPHSW